MQKHRVSSQVYYLKNLISSLARYNRNFLIPTSNYVYESLTRSTIRTTTNDDKVKKHTLFAEFLKGEWTNNCVRARRGFRLSLETLESIKNTIPEKEVITSLIQKCDESGIRTHARRPVP